MPTVGTINIDTRMNISAIEKGAARIQTAIGGMGKSVAGTFSALTPTVDIGSIVAKMGAIVKAQTDLIDSNAKLSDRLKIGMESLAGWQHAGDLAGVSAEEMAGAFEKLQKNLGRFADDGGKTRATLAGMGVDLRNIEDRDFGAVLAEIATRVSEVRDPFKRAGLEVELFGKMGQRLDPLLKEGASGIAAATKEAERFGLAVNRVDAAKIEAANDAMTRAKGAATGWFNRLAVDGVGGFGGAGHRETMAIAATKVFADGFGGTAKKMANPSLWLSELVRDMGDAKMAGAKSSGGGLIDSIVGTAQHWADKGKVLGAALAKGVSEAAAKGTKEWQEIGAALTAEVATPAEKAAAKLSTLQAAMRSGHITAQTFARQVAASGQELSKAVDGMDWGVKVATFAEKGKQMGEALAKGIVEAGAAIKTKWTKIGDEIKGATETPLERFQKRAAEIEAASKGGYITPEVAARANLANQNDLAGSVNLPGLAAPPSAAEFGSSAALNAIAQHRMQQSGSGGGNKSLPDLIKIAKQQEQEQKRAANIAEQQLAIWKAMKVVGI